MPVHWPTARNLGGWEPENRDFNGSTVPLKQSRANGLGRGDSKEPSSTGKENDLFWRREISIENRVELHRMPSGTCIPPYQPSSRLNPSDRGANLPQNQLAQFSELGALVGDRPSTLRKLRFVV
jgi:hypothetical protein